MNKAVMYDLQLANSLRLAYNQNRLVAFPFALFNECLTLAQRAIKYHSKKLFQGFNSTIKFLLPAMNAFNLVKICFHAINILFSPYHTMIW